MRLPNKDKVFTAVEIEKYKNQLIEEMKKQGATQEDFQLFEEDLFHDIVVTALYNNRDPSDVAWAILQ